MRTSRHPSSRKGRRSTARSKPLVGLRPKPLVDGSEPEKVIQRRILDWLKKTGLVHWRQNSGTVFAGSRMILLGEAGLPDIVVIIPPTGRFLGLEVKSAKGKLRPVQTEFKARIEATGGTYVVVRTLTQAMDAVAAAVGKEVFERLRNGEGYCTMRAQ